MSVTRSNVTFDGANRAGTERYSHVLVAVGRRPAAERLGLEHTRVQLDARGFVVTDAQSPDGRAHDLGRLATWPANRCSRTRPPIRPRWPWTPSWAKPSEFVDRTIPAVVFTDPEIAWAGLTEEQAKRLNRPYRVAAYPWAASGRAHSLGRPEGLTKWLVDPETGVLLGCGIVGSGAGELIGEAVVAIDQRCTVHDMGQVDSSASHAQRNAHERRRSRPGIGHRNLQARAVR